jgi:gliding motility-associated-like protein
MNRRYYLVFVILMLCFKLEAQPAEITYLGSVAKNGYSNNEIFGPFNIGFNFTFFGNVYSQFYINSNGQLTFGTGTDYPGNSTIPDATVPNNYIAPFWDDLTIDGSGNILYTTIGASPNRKLIVQFRNMGFYGGPVYMGTFYVILYEGSGIIQVQYRILPLESVARPHGESATIGLENAAGTAGSLYSFNNATAITSRQAISFTPSGGNYIINSGAVYDGVYLTTNLTLPEPGITPLISPPENAEIDTDHTFEWAAATNASSYSLKMATNSSLSGAVSYNAGSNLSYDISGLTVGTTYYWGVFATNATGTTWGEVKKFTVSANPPLATVPQTVYVEQTLEKTIDLNYTGSDAGVKTAIITALPAQGQLYQYNAGVKGALISTVPTTVTDGDRNVIYSATGTTGNGVGNFSYKMNDGTGDSPDALITVNVSPHGIPNLLYIAKSTSIEMQFDRPMADPAGKQGEFTATVNGTPVPISSLSLKTGDSLTIIATLSTPLSGGETVLIAYSAGTVASAEGGWLISFNNQAVTLMAQTITFSQSLVKTYGNPPFTLTATAPGGAMTYSSSNLGVATAAGSILTIQGGGSTGITARQAGNGTYAPAKYTRTLTVAKANQTITFNALPDKTYGDGDFTLSGVSGSMLQVTYLSGNPLVATVTGNTVHIVGAGTTTITALQGGSTNYNAAPDVQQTLTVNKADQTISFDALLDKVYGIPDYQLFASTSSGLTISYGSSNPAVATVTGNTVHVAGVGTTIITASQGGSADYNVAPDVPRTLLVFTANATLTLGNLSVTYNGLPQAATATTTPAGLSVDFTYNGSPAIPVNAGSYTVAASITDVSYHGSASATMVINKADQTISFVALPVKTYGDSDFTLSGVSGSMLQVTYLSGNPEVATVTGNTVHIVGAGTTIITASQGGDTNYNAAPDVQQTLTVNKADQTITFNALPVKTYGDSDFTLSAVSGSMLQVSYLSGNPEVATVTGNTVHIGGAGTTIITASQGGDANYNAAPDVQQTLTVNKADQTITFDALPDKTYGDNDFTLSGVSGSMLQVTYLSGNAGVATVTGNTVHIVGAGITTITASQSGSTNYNAAPDVQQILTVNKAVLTVTADDKIKAYGDANPALTVRYSGFIGTDVAGDIDTSPVVATSGQQGSAVGTYPVTVSGGNDNNYTFLYIPGTLTITKLQQTITFIQSPERLLVADEFTLEASSTSGLPVLFGSLDNNIATVSGDIIKGVAKGTVQIRAYHQGDINYDPAEVFVTVEVYSSHKEVLHLFTPNNDGFNDYWELPELAAWGKCDVRVFSRSGKLLYSNPDYNNQWDGTSNGYPVPEGAYYFIIKTENAGVVKGTINIVR